ncbi:MULTISPECIES: hypothetical protein [Streptomyces]|uniref:Uncharacterized protein n=1 Tax=Streptomyces ardesiacus TaxID=285564 RepID=A0ABW8HBX6_9ACTN|nr:MULTISPECIES: hypothetical protein [unclassified Streptomyces]NEB62345.1 hypothetical protein [Streptomyces diastaticus]
MPEQRESDARLAGRLYATLRVLKFVADPHSGQRPTAEDEFGGKDSPHARIRALKLDLFEDLVSAVQRGRHAEATAEVLRVLPSVVPSQRAALHANLGERPLAEFNAGYRAQLASLREALPELLG